MNKSPDKEVRSNPDGLGFEVQLLEDNKRGSLRTHLMTKGCFPAVAAGVSAHMRAKSTWYERGRLPHSPTVKVS